MERGPPGGLPPHPTQLLACSPLASRPPTFRLQASDRAGWTHGEPSVCSLLGLGQKSGVSAFLSPAAPSGLLMPSHC